MKTALIKTLYSNFNSKSKTDKKRTITRTTPTKPIRINNRPVSIHTVTFRKGYSGQVINKPNLQFWGLVKPPKIRLPHNSYFFPEEYAERKLTGQSGNLLNYYIVRRDKYYKRNSIISLSSEKSQQRMSKSFHSLHSKEYMPQINTKNPERSIQYDTHNTELSSKYYMEDSNRKSSFYNQNLQYIMKLQQLDEKISVRKKMLKQFDQNIQKIKYKKGNFFG